MGFPQDISLNGHVVDNLFYLATWLVVGTFLIIIGILFYCMVRFRAREGHRAVYRKGDTKRSTILTLLFAALVFVGLDVNLAYFDHHAFNELLGSPPSEDEALVIDVRAQQFQWNFRYAGEDGEFGTAKYDLVDIKDNFFGIDRDNDSAAADDLVSIAEVAIPVNKPVLFKISSNDVLHSFFLPHFRVKMDALPGTTTWIYVTATETGNYEIACAELCGLQHYKMKAEIHVMNDADYQAWIDDLASYTLQQDEGY